MKKIFLTLILLPGIFFSFAQNSSEVEQLKEEIKKLSERVQDLEKKQEETETKSVEAEKRIVEAEKKAEKAEKKATKDRVNLTGEVRVRMMREMDKVDDGFYGNGKPSKDNDPKDNVSFPTRVRLNLDVEVVPDAVNFYARMTVNKRWGSYSTSANDPFDRPNAFESSIGHDVDLRLEHAYATLKIFAFEGLTWYIGRLPGLDGAPSRSSRSFFPRPFIDSEIDGTFFKLDAPLDDLELPWTQKLWESAKDGSPSLESFDRKAKEPTSLILGYLKYDERGVSTVDDADVFLAQGELKLGKNTAIIASGLYMNNWHLPKTTFKGKTSYTDSAGNKITIPDITSEYLLAGVYIDTQIFGLQVYGGYYYCNYEINRHTWQSYSAATKVTTNNEYKGDEFSGHLWYVGFNTGDLIGEDQQLCIEYSVGSDAWVNPFNYRGYRRKGTVNSPANNYYYNSAAAETIVVGIYPFNAQVVDAYYDYYFHKKVRFRGGLMAFIYERHKANIPGSTLSAFGSSSYETAWWPYLELNVSF
jgi:hypothetical protein